ncbi:MAG TPA: response regulator [Cyclobacteriaceae bacterium]|jgi:CheY-like chemotaxis protein|nr:response regulator [Cyclobacteriaceae bacterium]
MKKILYVEDDPINALILRKLMQKEFIVEHVSDGESCIKQLRIDDFELVLMDINLGAGKMDGVETFKKIRETEQTKSIPVIAVTSYAMPEDRQRFLDEGFSDYVAKPIDRESLSATLWKFLL